MPLPAGPRAWLVFVLAATLVPGPWTALGALPRIEPLFPDGAESAGFVPNRGQWGDETLFRLVGAQGVDVVAGGAIVRAENATVRLSFEGSRADADMTMHTPRAWRHHAYGGRDSSTWGLDLPVFGRIRVQDAYPGIDIVYRADAEGAFEYDLVVAPGARLDRVVVAFPGADDVDVAEDGALLVRAADETIAFSAPLSYQDGPAGRAFVASRYVDLGERVAFEVGLHDPTLPLVVDPRVIDQDWHYGVGKTIATAVDGTGAHYLVTSTMASPWTRFMVMRYVNGALQWSASIADQEGDWRRTPTAAAGIATGGVAVSGWTNDPDFPLMASVQGSLGGATDAFVMSFASTGALSFSTYWGGSSKELGNGVAVASDGKLVLAGGTESYNFPVHNALQSYHRGGTSDAFLAKLAPGVVHFSTYLGLNSFEAAEDVSIAPDGSLLVVSSGTGGNGTFPGGYQPTPPGIFDAIVWKLDAQATTVLAGTFLGGAKDDEPGGLAVGTDGSVFVSLTSISFGPRAPGVADVCLARLTPQLDELLWITCDGSYYVDIAGRVAVDSQNRPTFVGSTLTGTEAAFPQVNSTIPGGGWTWDAFVASFYADGSPRYIDVAGTYDDDGSGGVAVAPNDTLVVGFHTVSSAYRYHIDPRPVALPPRDLAATYDPATRQVAVTWSNELNEGMPVTAHHIYRSAAGENLQLVASIGAATTWTETVVPDVSYSYGVIAENEMGSGLGAPPVALEATMPVAHHRADSFSTGPDGYRRILEDPESHVAYEPSRAGISIVAVPGTGVELSEKATPAIFDGTQPFAAHARVRQHRSGSGHADVLALEGEGAARIAVEGNKLRAHVARADGSIALNATHALPGGSFDAHIEQVANGSLVLTVLNDAGSPVFQHILPSAPPHFLFTTSAIRARASPPGGSAIELSVDAMGWRYERETRTSEPLDVTATHGAAAGLVDLSWSPPGRAYNLTGYRVHRAAPGGAAVPIADLPSGALSFEDTRSDTLEYRYHLTGLHAEGESVPSAVAAIRPPGVPDAPSSPQSAGYPAADAVALVWSPPAYDGASPVTRYVVSRAAPGGTLAVVGDTASASFTDSGLAPSTTYTYAVAAENAYGLGPGTVFAVESATPPGAPRQLAASMGPGAGEIALAWSAPFASGGRPVIGYRVYGGDDAADALLGETSSTTFTDAGLTPDRARRYAVSAVTDVGEGSLSAPVTAKTYALPSAPLSLAAQAGPRLGNVTLSWETPESDGGRPVTEYAVYRGDGSGSETLVASTSARNFTDATVAPDTVYAYRVAARSVVGEGAISEAAIVRSFAAQAPSAATNLSARPSLTRVDLWWSAPAPNAGPPARGYTVLRGSSAGDLAPVGNSTTTSFTDDSAPAGANYVYAVRAWSEAGEGAASAHVATGYSATGQKGLAASGQASIVRIAAASCSGLNTFAIAMERNEWSGSIQSRGACPFDGDVFPRGSCRDIAGGMECSRALETGGNVTLRLQNTGIFSYTLESPTLSVRASGRLTAVRQ